MLLSRPIILVFLPFAASYYLSYLFRTINALISQRLVSDLALSSADLGLLTSVFFLSFAVVQLPLGFYLDRYGPRRVQIALLPFAAAGALLFGFADGFVALAVGRVLIGIGVAAALMAGLKALVVWFPQDRLVLANGCFVTIGALGAVSATVPAELLLVSIGWRGLFEVLAAATVVCAIAIYLIVPEAEPSIPTARAQRSSFKSIYANSRFWRLAPISATCVGTSWALQGLWAASWLSDVEGLEQSFIVRHLFVMAIAICLSAFLIGVGADQLRRRTSPQALLATIAVVFILAQFLLILRLPVPSYLLWAIVAGVGATTVLSFAVLGEHFPSEIAGQANAALNVVHVVSAFLFQYAIGVVIQQWPSYEGHYPLSAYQTAFGINVATQIAALAWFMCPERNTSILSLPSCTIQPPCVQVGALPEVNTLELEVGPRWNDRLTVARASVRKWRLTAVSSTLFSVMLGAVVISNAGGASVAPYAFEADQWSEKYPVTSQTARNAPSDAQITFFLGRFITDVRSLSTDTVVVRARWLEAYDFTTDRAAQILSDHIDKTKPFANIGSRAVIVEVNSVQRVSGNTFEIRWKEQTYVPNRTVMTEHFTGTITIALEWTNAGAAQRNPFGLRVDGFAWSLAM